MIIPKDIRRKCYRILRCVADIKCLSADILSWAKMNGCERHIKAMLAELKDGVDVVDICDRELESKVSKV